MGSSGRGTGDSQPRALVAQAARTKVDGGFGGQAFRVDSSIAGQNIGDEDVVVAGAQMRVGMAQEPGASIAQGECQLTGLMGGNAFQRVVGGFAEAGDQVLAAFGQNADAKLRTGFQDMTYGATASQSDRHARRVEGALLHPAGKHGQVFAGLVRGKNEKPAGNAAKGPGDPIEVVNLFDALLVHVPILQSRFPAKLGQFGKNRPWCFKK